MAEQVYVISWNGGFIREKSPKLGHTSRLTEAKRWKTLSGATRYLGGKDGGYASQCQIHPLYQDVSFDAALARLDAKTHGITVLDMFQFLYAANLDAPSMGLLARNLLREWSGVNPTWSREQMCMEVAQSFEHRCFYAEVRQVVLQLTKEPFDPSRTCKTSTGSTFQPSLQQTRAFDLINPKARRERALWRQEITLQAYQGALPGRDLVDIWLSEEEIRGHGVTVDEIVEAARYITNRTVLVESSHGGHRIWIPGYTIGMARP